MGKIFSTQNEAALMRLSQIDSSHITNNRHSLLPAQAYWFIPFFAYLFFLSFTLLAEQLMTPNAQHIEQLEVIEVRDGIQHTEFQYIRKGAKLYFSGSINSNKTTFRITADATNPFQENYAILISRVVLYPTLNLNGTILEPSGKGISQAKNTFEPRLYIIPSALLKQNNIIEITVENETFRPKLGEVYFAPYSNLITAAKWRRFFAVDFPFASTSIGFFIMLLSIAVSFLARDRGIYLWFGIVMGIWSLRTLSLLGPFTFLTTEGERIIYFITTYSLLFVCVAFINAWTGTNAKYNRPFLIANVTLIMLGGAVYIYKFISPDIYITLGNMLGVGTFLYIYYRLYRYYKSLEQIPLMEIFAFTLCPLVGLADILDQMGIHFLTFGQILTLPYIPLAQLVLAAAMIISLAEKVFSVHTIMDNTNTILKKTITLKEQELESSYQQSRKQEAESAALKERERIMIDLHDGFAGQLSSLLARVRMKRTNLSDVESRLAEGLSDLRLTIDALTYSHESLQDMIVRFRHHIDIMTEGVNFNISWDVNLKNNQAKYQPDTMLHIYRIMQEAINNAIKHSNGNAIHISVMELSDPCFPFCITILDNGRHMENFDPSRGHGIANMHKRAQRIEARLSIVQHQNETTVQLRLPYPSAP